MENEKAKMMIQNKLKGIVESDSKIPSAYLLVHSDKHDIHWNMAYGYTDKVAARAEQPYHTASIAKTFTAIIIAMLVEQGKINYNDAIEKFLDEELIRGLLKYKGTDYTSDIHIEHLIANTAGLPDFYEDKPKQGKPFLDHLLDEPSRFWTPQETIHWTKENLQPRFKPGEKCHYTNTAYNLLGLIIENVTSKPFHEVLHEYIFQPLNMKHTYLLQFSEPEEKCSDPVANINMKGKEIKVEEYRSFSSIYAGGQTVSTSEDLLKFMKGLTGGKLISHQTLTNMMKWQKLWIGIDYGYGLMRIKMNPFTEKYNVWGHLGSIGSFMLYNPTNEVYIIGNFNRTGYVGKSVRYVYNVLRTSLKVKTT